MAEADYIKKNIYIKKDVLVVKIFLIILFYLIYALVSFAIVYSGDTADIANNDFEPYNPSISDLSEEERASYCALDNYIKTTICPRYQHQILKNEINYYQKNGIFPELLIINMSLSAILLKALSVERWWFFSYLVVLIIGFICSFVVWLIYEKYSSVRIKDYYEIHSSYDWESHYNYLLRIQENVIFRYKLRNIVSFLAFLCFIVATYYNI